MYMKQGLHVITFIISIQICIISFYEKNVFINNVTLKALTLNLQRFIIEYLRYLSFCCTCVNL